jgi:hypothetical protein
VSAGSGERASGDGADGRPGHARSRYEGSWYEDGGPMTTWLSDVLDSEAARYEPDSRRIRAAVHERLDGAARGRRRSSLLRIRLAGIPAGIAVAALGATVAVAVTATVGIHPRSQTPTSTSAGVGALTAASKSPSASAPTRAAASGTQGTTTGLSASTSPVTAGSHSPSASASAPASAPAKGGGGVVTASGAVDRSSNANWSQENVNITLSAPVTSFQLSVKVAMSPGLSSTGDWTNYDISMFDVTVDTQPDGVTYKFQLKPGRSLPAGSAEFAVQFAHGAGHNPADDTYYLSATADATHGSATGVAQGAF